MLLTDRSTGPLAEGPPAPRPPAARIRHTWRAMALAAAILALVLALGTVAANRYRVGLDFQPHGCLLNQAWLFVIDTHATPEAIVQGDLVAFRLVGAGVPAFEGRLFVKHAAGVPGDWVSVTPEATRINGMVMAKGLTLAKALGRDPASFVREARVPVEHFWMLGETADSFDSRYWGMLPMAQMIGKVHVLL